MFTPVDLDMNCFEWRNCGWIKLQQLNCSVSVRESLAKDSSISVSIWQLSQNTVVHFSSEILLVLLFLPLSAGKPPWNWINDLHICLSCGMFFPCRFWLLFPVFFVCIALTGPSTLSKPVYLFCWILSTTVVYCCICFLCPHYAFSLFCLSLRFVGANSFLLIVSYVLVLSSLSNITIHTKTLLIRKVLL